MFFENIRHLLIFLYRVSPYQLSLDLMKIRTEVIRVKMNCWWVLPLLVVAVNFGAEGKIMRVMRTCIKKKLRPVIKDLSYSHGFVVH